MAVLLAVVLPFVAFAFYINEQMADRLTRHVVQQALLGLVKDLAGQIDRFVVDRRSDLELWANAPLIHVALDDHVTEMALVARASRGEAPAPRAPLWGAEELARWSRRPARDPTLVFRDACRRIAAPMTAFAHGTPD